MYKTCNFDYSTSSVKRISSMLVLKGHVLVIHVLIKLFVSCNYIHLVMYKTCFLMIESQHLQELI